MLDVHALSQRIHGLKDFSLHILTITIGLLIALSLESFVEGIHHRDTLNAAKDSMHGEIVHNAQQLTGIRTQIAAEEKTLDDDLVVLLKFRDKTADADGHEKLDFTFESTQLDDAAWKTAQTAGAFTYMPYVQAQEFSGIYGVQDDFRKAQQQVNESVLDAAAVVANLPDGAKPTDAETLTTIDRVRIARMHLIFLQALSETMERSYQGYLAGLKANPAH